MIKILVVEDDRELGEGICYMLEKQRYSTVLASTIRQAKSQFEQYEIQMVLLDVNLPDGEGFEVCGWMKSKRQVPILFLTARDLEEDALKGYELGADDYVTKPFSMKILLKKIDLILQRSNVQEEDFFEDEHLRIHLGGAKVEVEGQQCQITPTEFRLLTLFLHHKGQLLTYEVLLERLWDCKGQFVDKHTLAVNVNRLRAKIEDKEHIYITNVYGMGYQWLKE